MIRQKKKKKKLWTTTLDIYKCMPDNTAIEVVGQSPDAVCTAINRILTCQKTFWCMSPDPDHTEYQLSWFAASGQV